MASSTVDTASEPTLRRRNPSPSTSEHLSTTEQDVPEGPTRHVSVDEVPAAVRAEVELLRATQKANRRRLTLLRSPFQTFRLFLLVVAQSFKSVYQFLCHHKLLVLTGVVSVLAVVAIVCSPGPHQSSMNAAKAFTKMAVWWIFLGILSSIGLGTGLHTFVLYLGPHIATITMIAFECRTLETSEDGTCPDIPDDTPPVTFWDVFWFVELESFMWGLGTALGELPPYFVARAARLSGERLREIEDFGEDPHDPIEKIKKYVYAHLQSFGFLGILLFASVPNPLFDLAGLTCGHFLIPFYQFFGATLIGKAIIKVNIQTLFVITIFSKEHLDMVVDFVEGLLPPVRGQIRSFLEGEREKLHQKGVPPAQRKSVLGYAWNVLLLVMVLWFVVSLINSTAQHHQSTLDEREVQELTQKHQWGKVAKAETTT